jgi:hypothetical protein
MTPPGILIGLISVLLFVACASGSPTDTPGLIISPTGQSGQQSGSTASLDAACEALNSAGGMGGFGGLPGGAANIVSQAQGGPSIQAHYSLTPQSIEVRELTNFFESALDDALNGGVSAECYWELITTSGNESTRAAWISLKLPAEPSAEAVQRIQDSLAARGATVGGFVSTPSGGEASAMIVVSDIPAGLAGETSGMLIFSEEYAVLIVSHSTGATGQSTQISPAAASGSATATPVATVPSQQMASTSAIVESLKSSLERGFGTDLEVEGTFQSSSGGVTSLIITYQILENSASPSNAADILERIALDGNANIESKMSIQGLAMVGFGDMEIDGVKVRGSIALNQDQNNILVNLQY